MRSSILKYLVIVFVLFSGCAYYNTFFNAKKFFKEAEQERKNSRKRQGSRGTVRQSSSRSSSQRGRRETISSSAMKKYQKSIEKASRVLELYPKSKYVDDALFLLGKSFFYRSEYRKAKRKFEELINNFPQSKFIPEARLWLGKTNTQLSDYETSESNFRDILNGKATQSIRDEAQFLLGGLYFHAEDYFRARDEYKVAAQNAKDKALRSKAYFQMGECYLQLKDYAAAASSFEKARKYSPDAGTEYESLFKAALSYKDLEDYDKAIDIFNELLGDINNEENWPDCLLEIADCLYLKGEITNAISWYESITFDHEKTDAAAKAYYQLGYIYQMHKSDYEQALEYYDQSVKEYSRSEIAPEAKAGSKNIQTLLALKADIKEQEKRIAMGDSVAAEMDSLTFETEDGDSSYYDLLADSLRADSLRADSLRALGDSLGTFSDGRFGDDSNRDNLLRNRENQPFNKIGEGAYSNREQNKNSQQKIVLKKGKLGTPKEELIKDKLMLAEIYLFEFNQPDSALYEYLDILEQDSTTKVASKAVYSIGYIYENFKNDTVMTDSIYKELLRVYPNSIYADKAREKLNLPKLKITHDDDVYKKFEKAEREYLDNQNIDIALSQFEQIAANYPKSKFASKSLYAAGWIYDNELNENDKALTTYQKLLESYPESDYSNKVKQKIDTYNAEKNKKSDESTSDSQDDTAEQEESAESTLKTADLDKMDKESYFELLRKEMDKDRKRLRFPKRIIK